MSTAMPDWLPRHRITVDEYHRMAAVGLLAPDARVELIQGEIIEMSPIGSLHAATVHALRDVLDVGAGGQAAVRVQSPVQLGESSEPQPDLALVARREDYYASSHPKADEIYLIVEVSETTLRYDREVKAALYAQHNVPEFWLVDLKSRQLHVFRSPKEGIYTRVWSTDQPGPMALDSLPSVTIDLGGTIPQ
jgi:Uma2 family endonuclease